jgi:hypothetical protein
MRPSPDEIEQRYQLLPLTSLAWLKRLKELGVSVDALCEPELPGQAQVVMHDGFLFDFADEADGTPVDAVSFLARDEEGEPADIVAWEPRSKRLAAWYGAVSLLGMENVFGPRLDLHNALEVFRDPVHWLGAERQGVVVVHPQQAAPILRRAEPLKVNNSAFGLRLANLINQQPPRILAPAAEIRTVA